MQKTDIKQFPPIIDGTYKKDDPHQDIGKSKYKVRRHYTAWVEYEVVANSKDEAEDAVRDHGGIEKIEWSDGYYGDDPVEVVGEDYNFDGEADSDYEKYREPCTQKVSECMPTEDQDINTDEHFLNYEDPEWVHDSYRWTEEEKQESDKKVVSIKEIPF